MKAASMPTQGERGFTLIELVAAVGLLAVALTAVYQLQARNLDLHEEARFVTRATQLARTRIAAVAARPELLEGEESGRFDEAEDPTSLFGWEEELREPPESKGLFHVRVRVFQENPGGGAVRDIEIETLLYRPEDAS